MDKSRIPPWRWTTRRPTNGDEGQGLLEECERRSDQSTHENTSMLANLHFGWQNNKNVRSFSAQKLRF